MSNNKALITPIGYYRKNILYDVYPSIASCAKDFNVTYTKMRSAINSHNSEVSFLKKNENVKKIHPNTYYDFYEKKLEKYIKYRKGKGIKFGCDSCLKKEKLTVSYSEKYQMFGVCEYCRVGYKQYVSVGHINKWLRDNLIFFNRKSHRSFVDLLPKQDEDIIKEIYAPIKKVEAPVVKVRTPKKIITKPIELPKEKKRIGASEKVHNNEDVASPEYDTKFNIGCGICIAIGIGLFWWAIWGMQTYNEKMVSSRKVQTVKAIILVKEYKKGLVNGKDNFILVYKNKDGNAFSVPNALRYYEEGNIGDSILVTFRQSDLGGEIEYMDIKKLNP